MKTATKAIDFLNETEPVDAAFPFHWRHQELVISSQNQDTIAASPSLAWRKMSWCQFDRIEAIFKNAGDNIFDSVEFLCA